MLYCIDVETMEKIMIKFLEKELSRSHYENVKLKEELNALKDDMKNKYCFFTKVEIHVGEGFSKTEIALRPDNAMAQRLTHLAMYTKEEHLGNQNITEPYTDENDARLLPLFKKFIIEDLCDHLGYKLQIDEGEV